MRHQEPGLSMTYRVTQPRTIGCERGCGARRRFDDCYAPSLLRRRKHIGPRAPHQIDLAFFTDEAVKDDRTAESKL